jgi:uncharacterized membrane protein YciS (DUF1049 family)
MTTVHFVLAYLISIPFAIAISLIVIGYRGDNMYLIRYNGEHAIGVMLGITWPITVPYLCLYFCMGWLVQWPLWFGLYLKRKMREIRKKK